MTAPPARNDVGGSGNPSRATAKTAFTALYDYVVERLGGTAATATTGEQNTACTAIGAVRNSMDADRILGRVTAGTGAAEQLTGAQAYNLIKAGAVNTATAVTLTNQTSVDFTSIPSWVKKITVAASGISTNGTTAYLIQLGDSGGIETSGYSGSAGSVLFSAGFVFANPGLAAAVSHAVVTITKVTGNTWIAQGGLAQSTSAAQALTTGSKTLSATLDRLRITTDNGTDQFDAGVINILWE